MTITPDVPCPFCGCLCDDLELNVADGRIVDAGRACDLARPQFLAVGASELTPCRIGGQPAQFGDAVRRAAEVLRAARYPLVWGLSRASCEAAGAAVGIAELLRGVIDVPGGAEDGALQTIGEVTCTLGEMRQRADLIVVWCADPLTTHPRFLERYAPTGSHRIFVVDSRQTPTAAAAERHLRINPGREFEAATVLRALAGGAALDETQVDAQTGVPLGEWRELAEQMTAARYGVLVVASDRALRPLTPGPSPPMERAEKDARLAPLHALVRQLNERTRWVSLSLPAAANVVGASNVLAWRTGYSRCVDFSLGFARYDPSDFAAERLLERGEVDAALIVCDDPAERLSAAACDRLKQIPTVAIDWRQTATFDAADVALAVAVPGVQSGGTMFRLDGVPLALRPTLNSTPPADVETMFALEAALS